MKITQCILIAVNILNLIDKKVIVATFGKFWGDIIVKFPCICYVAEIKKFFVYVHHGGPLSVFFKPITDLSKHEALAHPSLPDKYNHHTTIQM